MRQKIILGVIVAAVIGVFATGLLSWDKVSDWFRHVYYRGRGEVSKVQNIGKNEPVKSVPKAKQCRHNLSTIENAKRKVAQAKGMAVGRLTWKDLQAELPGGKLPKCPSGGEYKLGDIATMPKCTIGSNGTVRPEDDHIWINY